MKFILFFLLIININAFASGCGNQPEDYFQVSLSLGETHLEFLNYDSEKYTINLKSFDNKIIQFKLWNTSLDPQQIIKLGQEFEKGNFTINKLEIQNVLFRYYTDCDGWISNSSGVYTISISTLDINIQINSPSIKYYLESGYGGYDILLPLFK